MAYVAHVVARVQENAALFVDKACTVATNHEKWVRADAGQGVVRRKLALPT